MKIHIRADADFGVPTLLDGCEKHGFSYTFGLRSNARLKKIAQPLLDTVSFSFAIIRCISAMASRPCPHLQQITKSSA